MLTDMNPTTLDTIYVVLGILISVGAIVGATYKVVNWTNNGRVKKKAFKDHIEKCDDWKEKEIKAREDFRDKVIETQNNMNSTLSDVSIAVGRVEGFLKGKFGDD